MRVFYFILGYNMKKIIIFGLCVMLVVTMVPSGSADEVVQGFEETDFRFDVLHGIRIYWNHGRFVSSVFQSWNPLYQMLLKHIDIVSFGIVEDDEFPGMLFIQLDIRDLALSERRTCYGVYWNFEDVTYFAGSNMHTGGDMVSHHAGYFTQQGEAICTNISGHVDEDLNMISWVVPRDVVGDPSSGDLLDNIHAKTYVFYQKDCEARIKLCLASDMAQSRGSSCYSYELIY